MTTHTSVDAVVKEILTKEETSVKLRTTEPTVKLVVERDGELVKDELYLFLPQKGTEGGVKLEPGDRVKFWMLDIRDGMSNKVVGPNDYFSVTMFRPESYLFGLWRSERKIGGPYYGRWLRVNIGV